jgi:hypothetical protein
MLKLSIAFQIQAVMLFFWAGQKILGFKELLEGSPFPYLTGLSKFPLLGERLGDLLSNRD